LPSAGSVTHIVAPAKLFTPPTCCIALRGRLPLNANKGNKPASSDDQRARRGEEFPATFRRQCCCVFGRLQNSDLPPLVALLGNRRSSNAIVTYRRCRATVNLCETQSHRRLFPHVSRGANLGWRCFAAGRCNGQIEGASHEASLGPVEYHWGEKTLCAMKKHR
jgi:hypothetical protein